MTKPKANADKDFNSFRSLASNPELSNYEKIGFPDSYRKNQEDAIFQDITLKLSNLTSNNKNIVDIGPGCSDLPHMLIDLCRNNKHQLELIDCAEMLNHLPDEAFINKIDAMYPNCPDWIARNTGKVDAILCYSVLQYIIVDTAFFRFLDLTLSLLAPGGQILIGDIPNTSKRKRFFTSKAGIDSHKSFTQSDEIPEVSFNTIEHDKIDDSIVFAILQRARLSGFDSYLLPQAPDLPISNRREDILIIKP